MKVTVSQTKIGLAEKTKSPVKAWKKGPGNLKLAANAAYYYAKKHNERMIVIPGNSYMHSVFFIAHENEDVSRYTTRSSNNLIAIVNVDGSVFQGSASD